jgi:hypothetical protein
VRWRKRIRATPHVNLPRDTAHAFGKGKHPGLGSAAKDASNTLLRKDFKLQGVERGGQPFALERFLEHRVHAGL